MNPKRLEVLYELHFESLLSLANIHLHNPSYAEDLVQETFLYYMEKSDTYSDNSYSLLQIARLFIRKYNKQQSNEAYSCLDEVFELPDTSKEKALLRQAFYEDLIKEKKQKKLQEAFDQLSREERLVLYLFYVQDISAREISQITHFRHDCVRKKIERGKRKLHALYCSCA